MRAELEKNGVDIVLRAPVTKILMENGRAAGVVVNGKTVRAGAVLSNASLPRTVLEMIGPEHLPEVLRACPQAPAPAPRRVRSVVSRASEHA